MSRMFFIPFLMVLLVGVTTPGLATNAPTIEIEKSVHFLAPDGSAVLIQPGAYRVEAADNGLQLIPAEGNARLIGAEVGTHDEEVDAPLAVSLAGQVEEYKDIYMVMLLLPEGKSLEAAGSYSGVRERALQLKRIASFKKRTRSTIRRAAQGSRRRTAQRPRVARASASAKGGLVAYRLSGLWIHEESVSEVKIAQQSGGKWIWPGVYDVSPKRIHLTWELGSVPASDIPKIISQNGYGLELRLNGRLLKQGPDGTSADFYATLYSPNNEGLPSVCPTSKTCLGTTIQYHQWDSATPPWTVEISYWKQGVRAEALGKSAIRLPGSDEPLVRPKNPNMKKTKIVGVIYPNQTTGKSYFTHVLYPIFKHDRCTSCHTLGSKSALVERHHGLITADIIQEVQGHIGMNFGCGGGCHVYIPEPTQPVEGVVFHDSEWKTPRFDMGIDWRGKSDKYICQKVTSSLPTAQTRREHFFHDSRIAWAVHSGALPPPVGGNLPTAPPGDYWKFQNLVELWIRSGAPCPK